MVCDEKLMKLIFTTSDLNWEVYENSEKMSRKVEAKNETMCRKRFCCISMPSDYLKQRRLCELSHLTSDIHGEFT